MGSIVILSKTESNQPTVPSPPHAKSLIFGTCLNISIAWPGPPSVRSKTCLGLRSHWNFCINLAPWLPPDLGLRNTRIGATPGEGIGFRQKGLSLVSSWSLPSLARLVGAPTFFLCFFLLGEFFRLDLKLLFLGTLTIQEGGTMSWKNTRGLNNCLHDSYVIVKWLEKPRSSLLFLNTYTLRNVVREGCD